MFGKIVQLLGIPLEDGFEVVEGVEFNPFGKVDLQFATLKTLKSLYSHFKVDLKVIYCHGVSLKKECDGFKDFLVNNYGMPQETDVEERLWVIIPYSSTIETTSKKIAGRYPHEAILEMKVGDTVKVNKRGTVFEMYMVVQAGNELFLIKKNR